MSPATEIQRLAILILVTIAGTQLAVADWINLTGAETAPNIAEIYGLHAVGDTCLVSGRETPGRRAWLLLLRPHPGGGHGR